MQYTQKSINIDKSENKMNDKTVPGVYGKCNPDIEFFQIREKGHNASQFPTSKHKLMNNMRGVGLDKDKVQDQY